MYPPPAHNWQERAGNKCTQPGLSEVWGGRLHHPLPAQQRQYSVQASALKQVRINSEQQTRQEGSEQAENSLLHCLHHACSTCGRRSAQDTTSMFLTALLRCLNHLHGARVAAFCSAPSPIMKDNCEARKKHPAGARLLWTPAQLLVAQNPCWTHIWGSIPGEVCHALFRLGVLHQP